MATSLHLTAVECIPQLFMRPLQLLQALFFYLLGVIT